MLGQTRGLHLPALPRLKSCPFTSSKAAALLCAPTPISGDHNSRENRHFGPKPLMAHFIVVIWARKVHEVLLVLGFLC